MTYIHFFDSIAIESVCACLASPPEKLIVIGSNGNAMRRYARAVASMLHRRGFIIDTEVRTVSSNSLQSVYSLLCEIMDKEGNCSFCLNGGDELALVAVGMLHAKYGTRPKLHRFNLFRGTVVDLHKDGREDFFEAPHISVEEIIVLFGGKIVYENEKPEGTRRWDLNSGFVSDIKKAWDICKVNTKTWNNLASALGVLRSHRSEADGVRCSMPVCEYENAMKAENGRVFYSEPLLRKLIKSGLVTDYSKSSVFSVTFKDEQVMRLLTVAGLSLELYVFLAAKNASSRGKKTYDDVLNGVFIDWDGIVTSDGSTFDTENEIDIMMMRGGVPVFVSCKNGYFDSNELYKLSSVAERFGGKRAKKVLVTSSISSLGRSANYIRERAADMGITLIDNIKTLSESELSKRLSSLWIT